VGLALLQEGQQRGPGPLLLLLLLLKLSGLCITLQQQQQQHVTCLEYYVQQWAWCLAWSAWWKL
jgi:hypothetical protein